MKKIGQVINEVPYSSKFLWSKNFIIFVNYSWIMKISSQNAWLVSEEVSVLGTSNS